jgi:hypothetical protein
MKQFAPQVEIMESSWDEETNKAAILRAAGVCRKTDPQDFKNFIEKWIVCQPAHRRHMKLLEHSFVNFVLEDVENIVGSVHLRDWKRLLEIILDGDSANYCYWGSLRDLIDRSDLFNVKSIVGKYGLESLCRKGWFDVSDKINFGEPVYQIKIKTNRFTAMQLRTHQSISWLVESTRSVNYAEKGFNLCSFRKIPWYRKAICSLTYSIYKALIACGVKKEEAGRVLDEYRETHIIGFAHRNAWEELAQKRIGTGAQGDCEFIARKIMELFDEN